MDGQYDEACEDPGRGVAQLQQACPGGQQADDRVEQQVRYLHGARDLAQRRHGGDEGHDGDEEDGPGGLVGEVGQVIEGGANVGGDGADQEGAADEQQQALEGDGLGVELGLLLQTEGDLVQLGGVCLGPLVEGRRQLDGPEQEHDPQRVVDGVDDQGVAHVGLADVQGGLHGHHVAAAADPGAAESAQTHPGVLADDALHQHEGHHKADHDGEGGGEEADQHPGPQAQDLANVAAQQHGEDHGVGQVVFQGGVGGLGLAQIPDLHGTKQHGNEVAENHSGDELEEFLQPALGVLLQGDQDRCHEQQHSHISKAVCNHKIPLFLIVAVFVGQPRPAGKET